jgi:hypothetical protein
MAKVYGIELIEDSMIISTNVERADNFPLGGSENPGQLFFRTDENILYVRNSDNTEWVYLTTNVDVFRSTLTNNIGTNGTFMHEDGAGTDVTIDVNAKSLPFETALSSDLLENVDNIRDAIDAVYSISQTPEIDLELNDLTNVETTPRDGDYLTFLDGEWISGAIESTTSIVTDNGNGVYIHDDGTGTQSVIDTNKALNDLTDVDTFGFSEGKVLTYKQNKWVPSFTDKTLSIVTDNLDGTYTHDDSDDTITIIDTNKSMSDLTDVDAEHATDGQVLIYSNNQWEASEPQAVENENWLVCNIGNDFLSHPDAPSMNAIALGDSALASQVSSIAIGTNSHANGANAIAIGFLAETGGGQSGVAIGHGAKVENPGVGIAIGRNAISGFNEDAGSSICITSKLSDFRSEGGNVVISTPFSGGLKVDEDGIIHTTYNGGLTWNIVGTMEEAPIDGTSYVRQDASWISVSGGGVGGEVFVANIQKVCEPFTDFSEDWSLSTVDAPISGTTSSNGGTWNVMTSDTGDAASDLLELTEPNWIGTDIATWPDNSWRTFMVWEKPIVNLPPQIDMTFDVFAETYTETTVFFHPLKEEYASAIDESDYDDLVLPDDYGFIRVSVFTDPSGPELRLWTRGDGETDSGPIIFQQQATPSELGQTYSIRFQLRNNAGTKEFKLEGFGIDSGWIANTKPTLPSLCTCNVVFHVGIRNYNSSKSLSNISINEYVPVGLLAVEEENDTEVAAANINITDFTGHPQAIGSALEIIPNDVVFFTLGDNGEETYSWVGPVPVNLGIGGNYVATENDLVRFNPTDENEVSLTLDELTDVDTTGVLTGQVLTFNDVSGEWEPSDPSVADINNWIYANGGVDYIVAPNAVSQSIAIGEESTATGTETIAIGDKSNAQSVGSVVVGTEAYSDNSGVAIGYQASSKAQKGIAIGNNAESKNTSSVHSPIAIGESAQIGDGSTTSILLRTGAGALKVDEDGLLETSDDGGITWLSTKREGIVIDEDITYTVGTTGDFATLEEAFQYIREHPIATVGDFGWGGKRAPRYTLTLQAETHSLTGTNGTTRLESITAQVAINGPGATLQAGSSTSLHFAYCNTIFIDDITVTDIDIIVNDCYVNIGRWDRPITFNSFYDIRAGAKCRITTIGPMKRLTVWTGSYAEISSSSELEFAGYSAPHTIRHISIGDGSTLHMNCDVSLTSISNSDSIVVDTSSSLLITGDLNIEGGISTYIPIKVEDYGTISVQGTLTAPLYTQVSNIPINQLEKDGSAIWIEGDTTNKQRFADPEVSDILEAPEDGTPYSRQDATWVSATGLGEAPEDGTQYARQDATWVSATGLGEAPEDGTQYARQDATWVSADSGSQVIISDIPLTASDYEDGTQWFDPTVSMTFIKYTDASGDEVWIQNDTPALSQLDIISAENEIDGLKIAVVAELPNPPDPTTLYFISP